MKKAAIIILALSSLLTIACKEENEKPKAISYEGAKIEKKEVRIDTTQIEVADLPVHMQGTKYLIHPVGDVRVYDDNTRSYGSSRPSNVSYAISNYNRFELTGYFRNLKFQHIDSTAIRPLTDKAMQIQTVTYLNTVAERIKKNILIYTLVDSDTNKDGKIDANDIKSLYISDISGHRFAKLSREMQELIDWNLIEAKNRIYFRTIEDINKNGAFDKNDKVHYSYADLTSPEWKVEVYEPVK
jgi:hypothetical protein